MLKMTVTKAVISKGFNGEDALKFSENTDNNSKTRTKGKARRFSLQKKLNLHQAEETASRTPTAQQLYRHTEVTADNRSPIRWLRATTTTGKLHRI
jgi:hypothetical protein